MDLDLLKTLNDFAAAHDAFEDPVTFYNKVSILLFAGLLAVLFLFGRRQGARTAQVISGLVNRPRLYVDHASTSS